MTVTKKTMTKNETEQDDETKKNHDRHGHVS